MNRPRSDMQKHSKPTTLAGVLWSKWFPSRDAALRWFRGQSFKDEAVVIQQEGVVANLVKGPRGGVKVRKA